MSESWSGRLRLKPSPPESVYFYTFHKCASSLFSDYVLKNIDGLRHVDYDSLIYNGEMGPGRPTFEKMGHVYGPIRIYSCPSTLPVYKLLVEPTTKREFVRDKIAVFLVRDPRDILVSAYYSFGYSHELSPVEKIRRLQESLRSDIRKMSLDEYVLEFAGWESKKFEILGRLANACERGVVLKYEDMIHDFGHFIARLRQYLPMEEDVADTIYCTTRPKHTEDAASHRRSGQAGAFRDKLEDKTVETLEKSWDPSSNNSGMDRSWDDEKSNAASSQTTKRLATVLSIFEGPGALCRELRDPKKADRVEIAETLWQKHGFTLHTALRPHGHRRGPRHCGLGTFGGNLPPGFPSGPVRRYRTAERLGHRRHGPGLRLPHDRHRPRPGRRCRQVLPNPHPPHRQSPPTIADGTRTSCLSKITFPLVLEYVDKFHRVGIIHHGGRSVSLLPDEAGGGAVQGIGTVGFDRKKGKCKRQNRRDSQRREHRRSYHEGDSVIADSHVKQKRIQGFPFFRKNARMFCLSWSNNEPSIL